MQENLCNLRVHNLPSKVKQTRIWSDSSSPFPMNKLVSFQWSLLSGLCSSISLFLFFPFLVFGTVKTSLSQKNILVIVITCQYILLGSSVRLLCLVNDLHFVNLILLSVLSKSLYNIWYLLFFMWCMRQQEWNSLKPMWEKNVGPQYWKSGTDSKTINLTFPFYFYDIHISYFIYFSKDDALHTCVY